MGVLKNPLYGSNKFDTSNVFEKFDHLSPIVKGTSTLAIVTDSVQMGSFIEVSADAQTLTLPAVVPGTSFIIVCTAADGGALLTISPNASDKFVVDAAGAAGTDDKDLILVKATQKKHDFVHLVGLHADGWMIHNKRGVWSDES
tara:strand:+ start:613 stop:1044 length:432 start_codon:yes stop_codon:yes gene_type:complete